MLTIGQCLAQIKLIELLRLQYYPELSMVQYDTDQKGDLKMCKEDVKRTRECYAKCSFGYHSSQFS